MVAETEVRKEHELGHEDAEAALGTIEPYRLDAEQEKLTVSRKTAGLNHFSKRPQR